jgi:DNA-directed RNA polymerase subunit H (RpoH/RPB5)
MECKYAIKIRDFPYRLCKLQRSAPVGCNIIQRYEECQILKEYNIDTSALPAVSSEDIVRPTDII